MSRRIAFLSILILLAGCGGTTGSSVTPSQTVTPAPVPAETTDRASTPDGFEAPGIAPTGVVDAGRLVQAHAQVLGRESFTASINSTRRLPNGSVASRYSRRIQFAANKAHFYYVLEQMDRTAEGVNRQRIERWADGQRVVQAATVDGRRTTRVVREADASRSFPANATNQVDLYRLFTVMNTTLLEVFNRDGTMEYHLLGGPQTVPPLENVTLTAVVTERGIIRDYRVAYTVNPGNVRVIVKAHYEMIGRTDPPTPDWVTEMD